MSQVNVKVAVRCRPMSEKERARGSREIISMEGPSTYIEDLKSGKGKKQFTFDYSYPSTSAQADVYEELAGPILEKALEGYNGTIFAYGQTGRRPEFGNGSRLPPDTRSLTGSGKTHSMMGSGDDIGIIPLLARNLFR